MGLGRKGIFLSLSAILLVGVLFVVFAPASQREVAPDSRLHVQDTVSRIHTLQSSELEVWVEFTARQTLNQLARNAASATTSPYTNVGQLQTVFSQCILTGVCGQYGPGTTLESGQERVIRSAQDTLTELEEFYQDALGYEDVRIELRSIGLAPAGFRAVLVDATFYVELIDEDNSMELRREFTVQRLVPIEGLIDPLAVRINAPVTRIEFVPSIVRDVDAFFDHARSGTYVGTNGTYPGIPYLDRFTTNPQPQRVNSIHFLFPPGHYASQERSYLDFRHQGTLEGACLLGIRDPESNNWIYIDGVIVPFYGLVGLDDLETRSIGEC